MLPAPEPEPEPPAEPAEPLEPLPDAPLDEPDDDGEALDVPLAPDALPDVLPELLPLPEQPFCFHCESVGESWLQSVPFLPLAACDDEPEVVSFAAIEVEWCVLEVLSLVECFLALVVEDVPLAFRSLLLPVEDDVPLPYCELPDMLPEPDMEPVEPAELAVPLPSPAPPPVLPKVVPLEPVLFAPLDCDEGVPEFIAPVPMPLEVPVAPTLAPLPLSLVDALVAPSARVLEPMLELVLLWVVVSVCGEFLFFFMSPRAIAEPLARATTVVRTNAGASLRIWVSLSISWRVELLARTSLQAACHPVTLAAGP